MKAIFLASLLLSASVCLGAEEQSQTWTGQWQNNKYNTTGKLSCTAVPQEDNTYEGRFSGEFKGEAFEYTVTFQAQQQRGQSLLQGKAQLDGDVYEWSGVVRGNTFYGKFRSLKGNNGHFVLREVTE